MSGAKSKQPAPASAPIPSLLLEDFYTQPALAGELGVNKRTLQRWEQKRIAPPTSKLAACAYTARRPSAPGFWRTKQSSFSGGRDEQYLQRDALGRALTAKASITFPRLFRLT